MNAWREVWRQGIAPLLEHGQLLALRDALLSDDPRLLQGWTTAPPPLEWAQDMPIEAACAMGLCGWFGLGLETVGEVEEYFARVCFEADQRLGQPAAIRWFLNWYDDTPREVMRTELLTEVEFALVSR